MFSEDNHELGRIFGLFDDNMISVVANLNYWLLKGDISVLQNIRNGGSYGGDNISFSFPSDFDPWDEDYFEDGVMFQWGRIGVIIDNQTFYKYLKKAVVEFIELFPEEKSQALDLVEKIRKKYDCSEDDYEDVVIKNLTFND